MEPLDSLLLDNYPAIAGVRLNVLIDPAGNWVINTRESRNGPSTQDDDLKVMRHLRKKADLVVTSGATVRAEDYSPSSYVPIAVLSRDVEISSHKIFSQTNVIHKTLLISPKVEIETNESISCTDPLDTFELLGKLKSKGYTRILLETGPTLTEVFEPFLSEICITSPLSSTANDSSALITKRKTKKISSSVSGKYKFERFAVL